MSEREFSVPVRVYWEDTDAAGVVYHAQYVAFLERARSEWLRSKGISQVALKAQQGIQFVVASLQCEFVKPARFDDLLHVTAQIAEAKRASFRFKQQILRQDEILLNAEVLVVCVDAMSFKPRRLPEELAL
jgi:acyl-CoA thioester hydrolase